MSLVCDCISISWTGPTTGDAVLTQQGTYTGWPYFIITIDGNDYYITSADGNDWKISDALGGTTYGIYKDANGCPNGDFNGYWQGLNGPLENYVLTPTPCNFPDCCMDGLHLIGKADGSIDISFTTGGRDGIWNGAPYWQWTQVIGASTYYYVLVRIPLETGGCQWQVLEQEIPTDDPDVGTLNATLNNSCECPIGFFTPVGGKTVLFAISQCRVGCVPLQDRTQRAYKSIKLPIPFQEEDRGWKGCCECRMLVLAGGATDSWKNDVTSAWIKLSDVTDSVSFILEKEGVTTTYNPPIYPFPNEPNAYYTTIKWRDVLASDGAGCYDLRVEYNISGIVGGFTWGQYTLRPYTIQNALKTARIRVKFNLRQEVEGINFTDANVEDTIRFYGFIGERQPKTEIDNLIYQDRTMKSVVRENLDQWSIMTDPLEDCIMYKLTDLYLLSENEMWISDYNIHNHSYRIQDIPVILEDSPEIDYLVKYQRKAVLTAIVGRKEKNRRTYY